MDPKAKCIKETRPDWDAARDTGVDVSLIESNLRKTPQERIRAHSRALNQAMALKEAIKKRSNG
jgi:hypothetical protein